MAEIRAGHRRRPKVVVEHGRTEGVSPKVSLPTLIGAAAGLVLILFVDQETGLAVLLSALGYGGIGAAAGPGTVVSK